MIHPIFKLMAAQPTVLTDHLEAYAALVAEEVGQASHRLRLQALKTGLALACAATAAVLAGVALMLWGSTPPAELHAPWALWVAPALPALVAIGCWWSVQSAAPLNAFEVLRRQVGTDMALLREVGA